MRIAGRWMSVEEVLAEIERDRIFYQHSGGGMTLSGGEPLSQPGFAMALLSGARQRARLGEARRHVHIAHPLLNNVGRWFWIRIEGSGTNSG